MKTPTFVLSSFLLAARAATAAEIPSAIAVPEGATLILSAHGEGVQIYTCGPAKDDPSKNVWNFKAPQATLYDAAGKEIGKHYAGPTWQLTGDVGELTGKMVASAPGQHPNDIPWLLLEEKSNSDLGRLKEAKWVQRLDTVGGVAAPGPCTPGEESRIPYTATYDIYGNYILETPKPKW
jgi:Protein of unknown function (DUF3455)